MRVCVGCPTAQRSRGAGRSVHQARKARHLGGRTRPVATAPARSGWLRAGLERGWQERLFFPDGDHSGLWRLDVPRNALTKTRVGSTFPITKSSANDSVCTRFHPQPDLSIRWNSLQRLQSSFRDATGLSGGDSRSQLQNCQTILGMPRLSGGDSRSQLQNCQTSFRDATACPVETHAPSYKDSHTSLGCPTHRVEIHFVYVSRFLSERQQRETPPHKAVASANFWFLSGSNQREPPRTSRGIRVFTRCNRIQPARREQTSWRRTAMEKNCELRKAPRGTRMPR